MRADVSRGRLSVLLTSAGPTSHWKKGTVMAALSSADHLVGGKRRRNWGGGFEVGFRLRLILRTIGFRVFWGATRIKPQMQSTLGGIYERLSVVAS